ncbi:MAG: hypothetical protein ACJAYB_001599 [Psychromonas sp.]
MNTKISHKSITVSSDRPNSTAQQLVLLGLPLIDTTGIATAAAFQLRNIAWFSGGYALWQLTPANNFYNLVISQITNTAYYAHG